jgi:ketosteroid isomerase-like protein
MTNEEKLNLEIVKKAYAVAQGEPGGGDGWETFFADTTDETEFHEAEVLPYGGLYRGTKQLVRAAGIVFGTWKDFSYQIRGFTVGGNTVIVDLMVSAVGLKSGKSFSMPLLELWRMKNGKVTEIRPFYYDTARVAACAE